MVKVFRMRAKGKRRPLSSLVVEGRLGLSSLSADRDADGENSTTSSLSSRTELSATPTSRWLVGNLVDTVKEECQPSIASTSENIDENVGDPVLAMVVYKPNHHPSLLDAFQIWSKFCRLNWVEAQCVWYNVNMLSFILPKHNRSVVRGILVEIKGDGFVDRVKSGCCVVCW